MDIGVIGINYKSSILIEREKITRAFQDVFSDQKRFPFHSIFLSTCNRTEVYFSAEDLPAIHHDILGRLRCRINQGFEHLLYSYFRRDCFLHLARVTAGLDSAIFGETEIQRQVKLAYESVRQKSSLNAAVHYLFQKGLKIGKDLRTSFLLPKLSMNLSEAIFSLSIKKGLDMQKARILFVGNSELNRKLISYFQVKKANDLTLCSRHYSNNDLKKLPWDQFHGLSEFDLIIFATKSSEFLLTPFHLTNSFQKNLIFDLSIPRSVDPKIVNTSSCQLINLEEVEKYITLQQAHSLHKIEQCEEVVSRLIDRQIILYQQKIKNKALYEKDSTSISNIIAL